MQASLLAASASSSYQSFKTLCRQQALLAAAGFVVAIISKPMELDSVTLLLMCTACMQASSKRQTSR